MLTNTKLHYSFYGIEYQVLFAIQEENDRTKLSCIIEEACESNGRTIVEASSSYYGENVIESSFFVREQTEVDQLSQNNPFSKSDNAKALLRINKIAIEIMDAFFGISHKQVMLLKDNLSQESFNSFISDNIEHNI